MNGEEMTKEKITPDAIKKDLLKVANDQISNKADRRLSFIVPITLSAIVLGVVLKNIFVGLLISLLASYHIVLYVIEYKEYRMKKKTVMSLIERGDVSISTEILSHVAHETIYEPHKSIGRTRTAKMITQYHFDGGTSWREPFCAKHYEWSGDFYLSHAGLENISISGDEFFYIALQEHPDIAYIYPCKTFELDASLKKQQ
ncbi:MAG: hypothetical protein ACI3XI_00630 [Eubacteriales bacterium]